MSEYAWIRTIHKLADQNPDRVSELAYDINKRLDDAQSKEPSLVSFRELAWCQAYIHQLSKIAIGQEPASNGPLVQLFPGMDSGLPMRPVFYADMEILD